MQAGPELGRTDRLGKDERRKLPRASLGAEPAQPLKFGVPRQERRGFGPWGKLTQFSPSSLAQLPQHGAPKCLYKPLLVPVDLVKVQLFKSKLDEVVQPGRVLT
jgi:hypothetical protein